MPSLREVKGVDAIMWKRLLKYKSDVANRFWGEKDRPARANQPASLPADCVLSDDVIVPQLSLSLTHSLCVSLYQCLMVCPVFLLRLTTLGVKGGQVVEADHHPRGQ